MEKELKIGIWQVVAGEVGPHTTLEAYPRLLRTFKFFEVGSDLPIRLTSDEREQQQLARDKFDKGELGDDRVWFRWYGLAISAKD